MAPGANGYRLMAAVRRWLITFLAAMPLPSAAAEPCGVMLEDAPSLKPAWVVSKDRIETECRSCGLEVRIMASSQPEMMARPSTDRAAESKAFLDEIFGEPGQPQRMIDVFRKRFARESPACDIQVDIGRQTIDRMHFLAVRNTHFCPDEIVQHFGATAYHAVDNNCHRFVGVSWRYSGPLRREPLGADTLNKVQNVLDRLRWLD
jgi:hypothetical protein